MKKRSAWMASGSAVVAIAAGTAFGLGGFGGPGARPAEARQVEVDLDKAVAVAIPEAKEGLEAVAFSTPDGRKGWALKIPGGLPIATPAYADGMLFVGGGYGSHEFYAFDAKTGDVKWKMTTADDGPTAAVVEDGRVAFNTESCTVVVADAKTGKVLWQEWLGDPLMSQPALSKGRLYMAYPATKGDGKHRLLCADAATGRHVWDREITGDVVTAPVVDGDRLYFTCFDGTSFCLEAKDGAVVWKREGEATSAPAVADGQVVVTRKSVAGGVTREGIARLDAARGEARDRGLLVAGRAKYLDAGGGGGVAIAKEALEKHDAGVGFAAPPAAAQLDKANDVLGVQTVAGAWAYQGSRAAFTGGNVVNAQGRSINCVAASGGAVWQANLRGKGVADETQVFSPPSLGARHLYLCGAQGHLLSVDGRDGSVRFLYATGRPIAFQPALAEGRVFAGTVDGTLLCLETGDADADGWFAWGGNAQHNKKR